MQKYKLWLIAVCAILAIALLLFWLSPQDQANEQLPQSSINTQFKDQQTASSATYENQALFPSTSQLDTEINCQMQIDGSKRLVVNEQTRNCFEYFITQYGEKTIEQIQHDFKAYIRQHHTEPALSQILDLWDRYIQYRQAIGELTPPNDADKDSPNYYRSIFNNTQNLRKKFFSDYEIEGLFGTEDTYHQYTLNRMTVLHDAKLSEAEKAAKLKALFEELPQDWQENLEQLNKLDDLRKLTADIKARGGSADEIRQMRLNLVGPEATTRLETLDSQRSSWKNDVTQYLAERDGIVKSTMSTEAKQRAIQSLRQQHFNTPEDRLRIETFEQVHDEGGKLPFAD